MVLSSVRAIALLTVIVLALAGQSGLDAASQAPTPATAQQLQGKSPVCSSVGFVLLAGRAADPASSFPYQLGPNGHFFDPLGSEYVATAIDAPQPCPGPPSEVKVISPIETTSCGSVEQLTIEVTDVGGYNVKEGTSVGLTASLGTVPETVETRNGLAYASFLAPPATQGAAEVVVKAGAASAIKKISITCP
jgi:hypothetical protein